MKFRWVIILNFLLLAGCSMPHKTYPVSRLNTDIKAHFNYADGSYWIYKDSISGIIDSSYLIKSDLFLWNSDPQRERLDIAMMHNWDVTGKGHITGYLEYQFDAPGDFQCFYSSGSISSFVCFYVRYPVTKTRVGPGDPDSTYVSQIIPTFNFHGVNYTNVWEITHHNIQGDAHKHATFYFNDSVGMIKFKLRNDTVNEIWELQRHYIVKNKF